MLGKSLGKEAHRPSGRLQTLSTVCQCTHPRSAADTPRVELGWKRWHWDFFFCLVLVFRYKLIFPLCCLSICLTQDMYFRKNRKIRKKISHNSTIQRNLRCMYMYVIKFFCTYYSKYILPLSPVSSRNLAFLFSLLYYFLYGLTKYI